MFGRVPRAALAFLALLGVVACGNSPPAPTSVTQPSQGQAGSSNQPSANNDARDMDFASGGDPGGSLGCTPASCEALGKSCGVVADGCGGTVDCGSCSDGAVCGIVSANVCTPAAIASGDEYSSGRCETPPRHGIKIIAIGETRDINSESWYARLIIF